MHAVSESCSTSYDEYISVDDIEMHTDTVVYRLSMSSEWQSPVRFSNDRRETVMEVPSTDVYSYEVVDGE